MKATRIIVITGLSGSGRTTVSRALEDIGYFCVDNLPIRLLNAFLEIQLASATEITKVAFVMDTREREFVDKFPEIYNQLKQRGFDIEILFLDAKDEALLRRFSETRRPHPLAESGSVIDGIKKERELLEPVRQLAHYVIDTSEYNIHELRRKVQEIFSQATTRKLVITIESFGYKYGIPADSDIVLDVRFLPNPYFVEGLRNKSGLDEEIIQYVMKYDEAKSFTEKLEELLKFLIPLFEREGKAYLTVAIGCTGGRHRSVVVAEKLAEMMRKNGYSVSVEHRDLERG